MWFWARRTAHQSAGSSRGTGQLERRVFRHLSPDVRERDNCAVFAHRGARDATDERVARAIARCQIPVVSAIGHEIDYTGVDVSSIVIDHNNKLHATKNVHFLCGDAAALDLPEADVCLIRQVLQHLSNAQILDICKKCAGYRYIIVTEHYPPGNRTFTPNIDKPHGADTRLIDNSAVVLDKPPFSLKNVSPLFEILANSDDPSWGSLVTVVIADSAGSVH